MQALWTRSTLSDSIASRTPPVRPEGPSPLLAARMTAIASAASDSTASAISSSELAGLLAEVEQATARLRECRQRGYRVERVGKAASADAVPAIGRFARLSCSVQPIFRSLPFGTRLAAPTP